jgi:hypothetical protein
MQPFDDQYETISRYSSVYQIEKNIKGKQWIQFIGPSIHNLFADIKGNATITETNQLILPPILYTLGVIGKGEVAGTRHKPQI